MKTWLLYICNVHYCKLITELNLFLFIYFTYIFYSFSLVFLVSFIVYIYIYIYNIRVTTVLLDYNCSLNLLTAGSGYCFL